MPFHNTTDITDRNTCTNSTVSCFMICTPRQILLASLLRGWLTEGACATLQRGDTCIDCSGNIWRGKSSIHPGLSAGSTAVGLTNRLVNVWTGRSCWGECPVVESCGNLQGDSSAGLRHHGWYIFGELSKDRKASGFRNKLSIRTWIFKNTALKISDLTNGRVP